ncbi:hypothetical protein ACH5RR_025172 [Cinchona calisaya]|uniref:CCHC-type domain-containing protein n=1 Tax=Cinchona calisaya TaxID=153742 RepID=A0ABD2Z2A0_9GENT
MRTNQGGVGQNRDADDQDRRHQRSQGNQRWRNDNCFKYGKKGHHAKFCRPKPAESNAATSSQKVNEPDEDWDVQVSFAVEKCAFCCTTNQKDELVLTTVKTNPINYNVDWIIDFECSNHMTGDKKANKLDIVQRRSSGGHS